MILSSFLPLYLLSSIFFLLAIYLFGVKFLPDAFVETAEFDALHDDGIAYARRLEEAGVKVTLNETRGTVHAFDMAAKSSILSRTINKRIHFLRRALE